MMSKKSFSLSFMVDEDEIERILLANSPMFQGIMDIAEQQIREGKGIAHEDFWREVESGTPEDR
jgi:hypothetical protein